MGEGARGGLVCSLQNPRKQAAALDADGDGFTAAQEYIAGTDPPAPGSLLTMELGMVNGSPVISWFPDFEGERDYRLWANRNLMDDDWEDVTGKAISPDDGFKFFRVSVQSGPW